MPSDDSGLINDVDFRRFEMAVLGSFGDPQAVAMVRALPAGFEQMINPAPPGQVMINARGSRRLICTIEAWRSTDGATAAICSAA